MFLTGAFEPLHSSATQTPIQHTAAPISLNIIKCYPDGKLKESLQRIEQWIQCCAEDETLKMTDLWNY